MKKPRPEALGRVSPLPYVLRQGSESGARHSVLGARCSVFGAQYSLFGAHYQYWMLCRL